MKLDIQTNSNMQISMAVFTFFRFRLTPFWANFVQNVKIVSLRLNFVASLIRICRIQLCYSFFLFQPEILFLRKFDPKCQNYQFRLKFGIETNPNVQNSMMLFTFLVLDSGNTFLRKFGPKNQDYHFKMKFGGYPNWNMQNCMMLFTFLVFDWKYPIWANLGQKIKIVSLR